MSSTDDQVFLLVVIVLFILVIVGILLISNTLKPWFNTSMPPVVEQDVHPCEKDINSCTAAEFNAYCSLYDLDGRPSNDVISRNCATFCVETALNFEDDVQFCSYMPTCLTSSSSNTYLKRCIRSDGCSPDSLELCTIDEVTMLCSSGLASTDSCSEYCTELMYSCTWLNIQNPEQEIMNRLCPRHLECWKEVEPVIEIQTAWV